MYNVDSEGPNPPQFSTENQLKSTGCKTLCYKTKTHQVNKNKGSSYSI